MRNFWISLRALCFFTLIAGVTYPALVTVLGGFFLPDESSGSLVLRDGKVAGSGLIAQAFSQPRYFWPRPSAVNYDAASSGASNLSITSEALAKAVNERKAQGSTHESLYASGSGLDPHISPEAARAQIGRVAEARRLNVDQQKALALLIEAKTEERQFGFLGEPRINVLKLNLSLDEQFKR